MDAKAALVMTWDPDHGDTWDILFLPLNRWRKRRPLAVGEVVRRSATGHGGIGNRWEEEIVGIAIGVAEARKRIGGRNPLTHGSARNAAAAYGLL